MDSKRYGRVKELFLQACELDESTQVAFLQAECKDPEVRAEVQSLLQHHESKTIIAPPPTRASGGGSEAAFRPRRFDTGTLTPRSRRDLILSVVAIVVLAVAGWFTDQRMESSLDRLAQGQLEALRDQSVNALEIWLGDQIREVSQWARHADVREAVQQLVAIARTDPARAAETLPDSDPARRLRHELLTPATAEGYIGWAVSDGAGLILAASVSKNTVGAWVKAEGLPMLRTVMQGNALIKLPYEMGSLVEGAEVQDRRVMSALAPIDGADGKPIAVLVFVLDPKLHFKRILRAGRTGETGETYAFDSQLVLLSESRYDDQLRRIGLLGPDQSSVLNVQIRDPGVDLVAGAATTEPPARWPPTHMAAAAIAGNPGVDVEGYRDYRGVEVAGAWTWLDAYGFGVATEMDLSEVRGPLATLPWMFLGLMGLLAVAILFILGSTLFIGRLYRRIEKIQKLGQYTLEELIGQGGLGKVYKARHAMLRRPTAVKLLRPDKVNKQALQRFEREVQLTAQLTHPNTIEIYDYGRTEEGVFYYAMEYLPGLTVAQLVDVDGRMPPGRVVAVLRQVCGSLEEAHAVGMVHRDIKPQNVMLTMRGGRADVAKVLDFGLVKPLDVPDNLEISAEHTVAGTPLYIAPERLRDASLNDPRSDLYSVGVMAFRMLTAEELYDAGSPIEIFQQVLNEQPRRPRDIVPDLPAQLDALVMDCLAEKPEDRVASATELIARLDALEGIEPWTQADARAWWHSHAQRFGIEDPTRTHPVAEVLAAAGQPG